MSKFMRKAIANAILKHDDGELAEAIDVYMGHPKQKRFKRILDDLAGAIEKAIAKA